MQPRAERRAPRRLRHRHRHRRKHLRSAGRAAHGQPPMLRHDRHHLRQFDPLGHADDLGRKIPVQVAVAARAAVGTMIDHRVGIVAHRAAVALVPRLGPAGLGLLAPLFAVRRRWIGRSARSLLRALQPQHQLDQLLAPQPLKIASAHLTTESAKSTSRKGQGLSRRKTEPLTTTRDRRHPLGNYVCEDPVASADRYSGQGACVRLAGDPPSPHCRMKRLARLAKRHVQMSLLVH
ncbi:hypothetical protein MPOCJGCO_0279 [Methylobacterium trifolii]|uniref:Uncharacterized protein n=1 Tax=Methylobacterium trifolii TaxID=1003092 RepID=A0ABQ4TWE7_9HYPH|nr:hypothetical protein MPOCJGCO_0279 [Methylobacterium trifolii]